MARFLLLALAVTMLQVFAPALGQSTPAPHDCRICGKTDYELKTIVHRILSRPVVFTGRVVSTKDSSNLIQVTSICKGGLVPAFRDASRRLHPTTRCDRLDDTGLQKQLFVSTDNSYKSKTAKCLAPCGLNVAVGKKYIFGGHSAGAFNSIIVLDDTSLIARYNQYSRALLDDLSTTPINE
ncbi:uncharacterized protein LOC135826477 [Sycon ciliatum]|uniref:uncharacterized protein LOC135825662 n=1 Tax=Sycon ciliatum TaxID=27933 RepID=UPI0020A8E87A